MRDVFAACLVTFALAVGTVFACGTLGSQVKDDIVDCTAGDIPYAVAAIVSFLDPLLTGDKPDWNNIEIKAENAGGRVGGCVLADLVDKYLAKKKALPPGVADPRDPRPTLDAFRAKVAPGKSYKTAGGSR